MEQKKISGRIRIKDIADMANVSPGTVDRVIHNRGGVAPESKERIEKILKELDFRPNKMAQMLAIKKGNKMVCILPETKKGGYWHDVIKGIKRAEQESADYKVQIELLHFDQYDAGTLGKSMEHLMKMNPDGVVLAPFFRRETLKLTKELEERRIPFVFIDSNVNSAQSLAYYGQHSHRSGYMAAKLMFNGLPEKSTILLVHMLRGGAASANQTATREEGFVSYIEKHSLEEKYNIMRVDIHAENEEENFSKLDEILKSTPDIRGAISFNSRIYRIADYIEEHKLKNIRVIGYDLLERNVRHLKHGTVECLIAQRPQLQGYYGVMALTNYLVFDHTPSSSICYMPIDILFKENIEDYKVYPFDADLN